MQTGRPLPLTLIPIKMHISKTNINELKIHFSKIHYSSRYIKSDCFTIYTKLCTRPLNKDSGMIHGEGNNHARV